VPDQETYKKVNYCQCGMTIIDTDHALSELRRFIKECNKNAEEEGERILEKMDRVRMAITSMENICDIKFKKAKQSSHSLVGFLPEINTEKGRKDILGRINTIDSEIYREFDNCSDKIRIDKGIKW